MLPANPVDNVIETPLGEQRFEITQDGRLRITCPARDELLLVDVDLDAVERLAQSAHS